MNDHYPATQEPVIIVGAGPAGCTAALLLADFGIPVTLLERHTQPHPLPRAVHLDDEVARILDRIGVSEGFLARSRPGSGLRLLDAGHRVMAEFRREHQASEHGFPQANMFHQPDLEELMLARVKAHPLIDLRRGAEVCGMDERPWARSPRTRSGYTPASPETCRRSPAGSCWAATAPTARSASWPGSPWTTWASPSAGSWSTSGPRTGLDTWDGVEQICDPARAATFMQVTGDRYRWEFRLVDGEDEAGLITPAALGAAAAALDRAHRPGRPADHPHRHLYLPGPAGVPLPDRARLPARRRRAPHPAVHRPGPGRRAARRRQPGLEARPRAHRPGRGRTCWPATRPNAARTPEP